MFSGIVEALGEVVDIRPEGPGYRLVIKSELIASDTKVADSICVNGCCLTVVEMVDATMAFDCSPETMDKTNLGDLSVGGPVNLERALAVGQRLGGHFLSGHIDGCGELIERDDTGEYAFFKFSVPRELAKQMASKGSIGVDGVSLTICDSEPDTFRVALIPFTLQVTTLGPMKVGDRVNLETDILAKYVQRLHESEGWDEIGAIG